MKQVATSRRWILPRAALAAGLLLLSSRPAFAQPSARFSHAAISDPVRERMLVFAGAYGGGQYGDLWELSLGGRPRWSPVTARGTPPNARYNHSAIYDPVRGRMLVFGGYQAGDSRVWSLSLADTQWSVLDVAGTPPSARAVHSAIYDPVRDRMVIFGGYDGRENNDVWTLSLSGTPTWDSLRVAGFTAPPLPREGHTAVYDPIRDRMLVFGGYEGCCAGNGIFGDVWAFSLSTRVWSQLNPTGSPPFPRNWHSAIYDPVRDRMLIYGGRDGFAADFNEGSDVWELSSLGAPRPVWKQLGLSGPSLPARSGHTAIYDPARDAMVVFGGATGPSALSDAVALHLSGALGIFPAPAVEQLTVPSIVIPDSSLAFPPLTAGDTGSLRVLVANTGSDSLEVTAIDLPSPDLHLATSLPFMVPPGDSLSAVLVLEGLGARLAVDSIAIESTDPVSARLEVGVRVDVAPLEVRSRLLGGDSAALGLPLLDVLTFPRSPLSLERKQLFFRPPGSEAPFDSASFDSIAGALTATIPGSKVSEAGLEYYALVEHHGFVATDPPGAPGDSLFTQIVAPPSSIAAFAQPTSGSDFVEGEPIAVQVAVPDGATFVSGALHYRRTGERAFRSAPLVPDAVVGRPIARIPAASVGAEGADFWVGVQTLTRSLIYPSRDTAGAPARIRVRVQRLIEPASHAGGVYRMVSVPLDFGTGFSGGIDAILNDQLGVYGATSWRCFRYDPGTASSLEWSSDRDSVFHPAPGRAFWLISRDAHRIDTYPIDGLSTASDSDVVIVLRPGWNQIGDPFDFPVAWSSVEKSAAISAPVPYVGSARAYGDPASILQPFEGYFVRNSSLLPEALRVPPIAAPEPLTAGAAAASRPSAPASGWRLDLRARTPSATGSSIRVGVDPGATTGLDPLDAPEPPCAPGDWVELGLRLPPEAKDPDLYRRDFRPAGAEGWSWALEVRSSTAGETIAIDHVAGSLLPDGVELRLIDRELGSAIDLRRADRSLAGYEVLSHGPGRPYRLSLLAGSADYVARDVASSVSVPRELVMDAVVPNPTAGTGRIRFGLPHAQAVTLEVFSVLGGRVATLLDREWQAAGYHALLWDGRTLRGSPAAQGVYFARLSCRDGTLGRRIVRMN